MRKAYWDKRAKDIDRQWGEEKEDYPVMGRILSQMKPEKVLDIGCGSGRLFPLYLERRISEVTGQDISEEALEVASSRYRSANISTTNLGILNLQYPLGYFDLIVSNRVLQHIPHRRIREVVRKLTELGKAIYINEMSESDDSGELFYLFKHDYRALFHTRGYDVLQQGLLGRQTWYLFSRRGVGHERWIL